MDEEPYRLKCVNGHDRCYMGPDDDCPYCERVPIRPLPNDLGEILAAALRKSKAEIGS
jgi:hypothetical protein